MTFFGFGKKKSEMQPSVVPMPAPSPASSAGTTKIERDHFVLHLPFQWEAVPSTDPLKLELWNKTLREQIIVSINLNRSPLSEAEQESTANGFARARLDAISKISNGQAVCSPVRIQKGNDQVEARCIGCDGSHKVRCAFAIRVTRTKVVTVALTRYFLEEIGKPFDAYADAIFDLFQVKSPESPTLGASLDLAKVYPYVVPEGYAKIAPPNPKGFLPTLGHNVYAMLVQDLNGICRNLQPSELEQAKVTIAEAHRQALANLELLAKGDQIRKSLHRGPDGLPFILWSGHWLAASCIRLPELYNFCSKQLQTENLCVSIPQRETMLVFPTSTRQQRDQMRAIIRQNESDARKLVTWELFTLSSDGLNVLAK